MYQIPWCISLKTGLDDSLVLEKKRENTSRNHHCDANDNDTLACSMNRLGMEYVGAQRQQLFFGCSFCVCDVKTLEYIPDKDKTNI